MSQPIQEQLSVFMDGELGRDETRFLLKSVAGDAALAGRWSRYHVIRQAMRRQEIVVLRADFTESLMARLDEERVPMTSRGAWLRWGSGGAIAAAVAVAALIVTKPVGDPASTSVATSPVRAVQNASANPAQLASANAPEARPPALVPNSPIQTAAASFGTDVVEPASFDPRMQSYLIRHYQATGSTGESNFVPYILLTPQAQTAEPRQPENR